MEDGEAGAGTQPQPAPGPEVPLLPLFLSQSSPTPRVGEGVCAHMHASGPPTSPPAWPPLRQKTTRDSRSPPPATHTALVSPGAQDTGRALVESDPSLNSVAVSCNTGTMKNLFMRKPSSFKSPSFNSNWEQLATS